MVVAEMASFAVAAAVVAAGTAVVAVVATRARARARARATPMVSFGVAKVAMIVLVGPQSWTAMIAVPASEGTAAATTRVAVVDLSREPQYC